jgi:hypothetical protein
MDVVLQLNAVDSTLASTLRLHLPRKTFLGGNTSEVIAVRSFALLNFINSLGRSPRAMQLPVVLAFLEVDRKVRGASAFTRHCGVASCMMEGYLHKQREHRHSQWPLRYFCLTTQAIVKDLVTNGARGCSSGSSHARGSNGGGAAAGAPAVEPLALVYFDAKETVPWTPKGFLDLTYVPGQTTAVDIQEEVRSCAFILYDVYLSVELSSSIQSSWLLHSSPLLCLLLSIRIDGKTT